MSKDKLSKFRIGVLSGILNWHFIKQGRETWAPNKGFSNYGLDPPQYFFPKSTFQTKPTLFLLNPILKNIFTSLKTTFLRTKCYNIKFRQTNFYPYFILKKSIY